MGEQPRVSFEELAEDLGPSLTAYLRRMTDNAADADDLLQETLLRAARALPGFEYRSSLKTWAFRIATNVAMDYLRKAKKTTVVELNESDGVGVTDAAVEDDLVAGEMNACIRGVIDSLPPDYSAPLVLSALQGKSVAEVAEICGITVAAAKVRVHRAKARLRVALEGQCDFSTDRRGSLLCEPMTSTDDASGQ